MTLAQLAIYLGARPGPRKWGLAIVLAFPGGLAEASNHIAAEAVQRFVAVIVDNGCRMTNDEAETLMPAAGFTDKDHTKAIARMLMDKGHGEITNGSFVLSPAACEGTADLGGSAEGRDLRADFLAYMATRDCRLPYDDAETALPEAGFDLRDIDDLAGTLMEEGIARVEDPGEILVINEGYCG